MTDLAPSRPAHESNFANAERREVVMQHKALGSLGRVEHLNTLLVFFRAERHGHERLRLAAREQRRAMRAREHTYFGFDGADLIELAAIGAAARLQHLVAKDALFEPIEQVAALFALILRERSHDFVASVGHALITFKLLVFLRVE